MRPGIFALLIFSIALLQACQKEIDESILDEIPVPDSLAIRYFTPDTAKEGTNITIVGSGFDTAFINNSVKLNGTALSIVNATDTSLVVTIPQGATTGKISITVNGKTVFTENDLVVQDDIVSDTLAIRYFTPDTASAGMNVTIVGSGFDTDIVNNLVKLNATSLTVVSVSDTSIIVIVPDDAATGKISVTVKGETAVTEKDLVILLPDVEVWVQKTDFKGPVPNEGPGYYSSFSINGKGYYLYYDKLWMYSPETNEWTQKQSVPATQAFQYGFCFTIGDKAYIGLGDDNAPNVNIEFSQVWEYSATANAWTRKNDFPGISRLVPFSFAIGNTGYIGCGTNWESEHLFDFWKYDQATDTWAQLKNFPGSRGISLSGVTVENNGFVIELGQNDPTAPLTDYKDIYIWKYDRVSDTWEKKEKLPVGDLKYDGGGTAFVINNKIYLGAGAYDSTEVNGQIIRKNFWMYDPVTNSWTNKKDIGGGLRLFGQGFAINGKGYIGLGTAETADDVKKDFWEYTP